MTDTPRVKGKPRNTTIVQDLQDIAKGIGRSVGGALGNARDAIQARPKQIDDAETAALSPQEAQSTDRHNGYP